ncbi:type II secretion system secretin GspD [Syntrophus buswellii]|uniref:type II secretion system secretin GspD n=1 Tax=Syntrophus buswellii TaxID=43774 RepID=UPI0009D2B57A|nr:MAG: Type II secretion system protein D precursor [Syntrophus sp. PtaB.Bin138]
MIKRDRQRTTLSAVFVLVCILALSGCMNQPRWRQHVSLDRPAGTEKQGEIGGSGDSEAAAMRPPVEEITVPAFERKAPQKKLPPPVKPIEAHRVTMVDTPVMINAERMPLSDFIIHALGETLKVAFVMDEKMLNNKKPITMRMPEPMPPEKALEMIMGMLEKYGYYLDEKAGALYVLEKPPEPREPRSPVDIRVGTTPENSPAEILQVVPLRHVRPADVEPLIKDLFRSGVQVKPYSRQNVIVLYGRASQMKPVMEFLETFDVPYLQKKKVFILRLTYWQTDEFIAQLKSIMEGLGFIVAKTPREPGPLLMPIKQLNAVLVIAPDETTAGNILGWKEKLDTPEAAGTEFKAYTFIPKYSLASELVESIQKLYGSMPVTGRTAMQAAAGPQRPAAARAAVERKDSSFESTGLKMSADDKKNMIIILSTPDVYRNLLNLLQTLDIPARQVLIEATIVSLKLTDELKYGVEWLIRNTWNGDAYVLGTLGHLGTGLSTDPVGLSYSFLSRTGQFRALINAYALANKANILSTPRLMVLDNMEATIQIGQDVPTVTGQITDVSGTTTSSTSVAQSIQYRSTGIMLKVKPTINTEGLLTLEISQEVSKVEGAGVGESPIITTRKINTSVVATHGQTIVLGGLMEETSSLTENKVPLLGDIPFLGNLFKSTGKTKEKTELLVLVTPTILTNADDATRVTRQLRDELKWIK